MIGVMPQAEDVILEMAKDIMNLQIKKYGSVNLKTDPYNKKY